jgi:hypothetical protein
MTSRMEKNLALMSPDTMMSSWMAVGTQAQDAFLKLMTNASASAMRGYGDKS